MWHVLWDIQKEEGKLAMSENGQSWLVYRVEEVCTVRVNREEKT